MLLAVLILLGFVAYIGSNWYERFPWIQAAAYVHSQRGSIDCGDIVEPNYPATQAAINCATSAHEKRHPFVVIFTVHGIDDQISNAVIGDSKGSAIEIVYATGMVTDRNTLLRHHCSVPVQLQVDGSSRLHCAPWPPAEIEKDHFFW
jgi:hypothetical protein